ncbi:MAG TPA: hypothetical protein VKA21_00515 [Candidatus Binatia bacterium]|nr:hypothetical protein [Candidatus Binatia bacterium]
MQPGLTLLDLLVAIALLAILICVVRLDWRHDGKAPPPAAHGATRSSFTSV